MWGDGETVGRRKNLKVTQGGGRGAAEPRASFLTRSSVLRGRCLLGNWQRWILEALFWGYLYLGILCTVYIQYTDYYFFFLFIRYRSIHYYQKLNKNRAPRTDEHVRIDARGSACVDRMQNKRGTGVLILWKMNRVHATRPWSSIFVPHADEQIVELIRCKFRANSVLLINSSLFSHNLME